ncbi:MAG: EAL domain-containing protein [Chromatiales bacterium]|nr:EAL domain-containing protein [Chromatiales bacterium]
MIDPSATSRYVLVKSLGKAGHDVVTANDSQGGFEQLKKESGEARCEAVVLRWPPDRAGLSPNAQELLETATRRARAVVVLSAPDRADLPEWSRRHRSVRIIRPDDYPQAGQLIATMLSDSAVNHDAPADTPLVQVGAGTRVLLVDDSPSSRTAYRRLLEREGYEVETAFGVSDGLAKAKKGGIDIAIIDYFMPEGNGDELCRMLRDDPDTRNITSTILTSTYLENVITACLEAGAVECMFKDEAQQLFLSRVAAMSRMVGIRKQVDAEHQRMVGILDSVAEGVYGVDREGRITFMNRPARAILAFGPGMESPDGREAHEVFHYANAEGERVPKKSDELHQAYLSGAELTDRESVFFNRYHGSVPVQYSVRPLRVTGKLVGSVVAFRDITDRLTAEQQRWRANHDSTTSAFNSAHLDEKLSEEMHRLRRSQGCSALLHVDIDHFALLVEMVGEDKVDELLAQIARRLAARLRDADLLARTGQDEFDLLLRDVSVDNIYPSVDRFRHALEATPIELDGHRVEVRASAGVAILDRDSTNLVDLKEEAARACRTAKQRGRNLTHVYLGDRRSTRVRRFEAEWLANLRRALVEDRFVLYLQAIASIEGLDLSGVSETDAEEGIGLRPARCEVAVRLLGADGAGIPPEAFIATAEQTSLIQELDAWALEQVLILLKTAREEGRPRPMALNLSINTLTDPQSLERVVALIGRIPPHGDDLAIELDELDLLEERENLLAVLRRLRALGCLIVLDAFGLDPESLTRLRDLPVNAVKLSGAFVGNITRSSADRELVASMLHRAKDRHLITMADHVDNLETLRLLQECGVRYVQGRIVGEPGPVDQCQM